jgi:chitinase
VVVVAAAPVITVSLTNPVNGAVFAAPAKVNLAASTSVSSGSVTNVTFFNGKTVLGSAEATPFSITASNLAANTYALTAVATAAGVSATSSVVNITVVSPVTISNSAPLISNGLFTFGYSASAGLTYVVQDSSDLVNWISLLTNVAAANSAQTTDTFVPGGQRFYRIILQPNP